MLRRLTTKGVLEALASTHPGCASRRIFFPGAANATQWQRQPEQQQWISSSTRGLNNSSAAAAAAAAAAPSGEKRKQDWAPGTPPAGRDQTIGEAFAAMQYHARGTRKVKASVLNRILERVTSAEDLKYACLGLKIFKTQGIDLEKKTATLFVKACCKAGSPQMAVDVLGEAAKYGLDGEGVVSAHRFNYLLSQLYIAGDSETFTRAVSEAEHRQQSLNARSHTLISKFEGEMRAKEEARVKAEEEEAARVKAEEEEAARAEEEEKARIQKEEEERKAQQEAAAAAAAAEEASLKEKAEEEAAAALEAQKAEEDRAKEEAATAGGNGDVSSPGGGDAKAEPEAEGGEEKR
ncbi:unnamed protein product [Ectocarpus sp. CCAP 1310/34]|nr:unnamed protein product [Ectocarpus sp. CCAP 1310/34]